MTVETTYSNARAHLAHWLDRVTEDREVVLVKRRGRSRVALVAADDAFAADYAKSTYRPG